MLMEHRGKIRWGLLGAGRILDRWMNGARQVEDMEIAAIASRTKERAQLMADRYGIQEAITYEEMLEREDIDVVYIPVPHTAHKELAVQAMDHGKAVLVEKPAGINAKEHQEMVEAAKRNKVFYMEAVWNRFFPMVDQIHEMIGENGIGEVRAMNMAFSYRVTPDENVQTRIIDPKQAGGGLLDVGVYNLHFAQTILEKNPVELIGMAAIDSDEYHIKVDEQASYIAKYDRGELVMMSRGIRTQMEDTAYIYGTKGYIVVPVFWKPTRMKVVLGEGNDCQIQEVTSPVTQKISGIEDEGFQYEIIHVNDCLRKGLMESPVMTWEKTGDILEQCDSLRAQWGLKYPME
ncbi:MAG: Gfo/Idh/MocA family oxidoreductase [Clostridia bacterium]|nr:Gfo/Idh/MocA family oxidoreductase [Clostridia bacterium]